ncbi:MAG: diguanylate cyclase [Spirochaetaceae bacterium]|nr:diguanylate cyclase [Spirochaetaceae bacterium]
MRKTVKRLHLKFILLLMGLGFICSMGTSILIYSKYHNYIISSLQKNLCDAGRLLESQLPVLGDVEYLRREGIAKSEAYMDILLELQKYNDAFGFSYIYLVEKGPEGFVFLLDTDILKGNDTFLHPYSAVKDFFELVIEKQQTEISNDYKDEYGTFFSAFIPVIRQDKVVSIIGIDYEISLLHSLEHRALIQTLASLAINLVFVVIMAIFISIAFVNLIKRTNKLNKRLLSANKKLEFLSGTDDLTKLNNRRSFLKYMDFIWKQNYRLNLPVSVLMLDVDYFKKYNDSQGHLEGDKVLAAIAQCMKNHMKRETDFIARYGGEEFVCLLPFVAKDKAEEFAKTLIKNIEDLKISHPMSENSEYITISAGIASVVPGSNTSQTQLLDEADRALYKAKELGRNKVVSL